MFFNGPFGGAYIRRGLCSEGKLRFKIEWARFIVEKNVPFLLYCTLYLTAISKYMPPGGLVFGGVI